MRYVVTAIQNGESSKRIKKYLSICPEKKVRKKINTEVDGFPPVFYAAQTNDESMIRLIASYGDNVDAWYGPTKIPLLAYIIVNAEETQANTTTALTTLLSLGSTADAFPKAFYYPYNVDLPASGPIDAKLTELNDENKRWCLSGKMRSRLAQALNLTQRYFLDKSTRISKPTVCEQQVAKLSESEGLFGIPYFLIGRTPASALLKDALLCNIMEETTDPLVVVFAGPSGHGKTELARRLGHLLSLDMEVIDCTSMVLAYELWGCVWPLEGWKTGSPLNNFLARNSGKRSIVFLDEFEKCSKAIHNTLLVPFDEGNIPARLSFALVHLLLETLTDQATQANVETNAVKLRLTLRRRFGSLQPMHLTKPLRNSVKRIPISWKRRSKEIECISSQRCRKRSATILKRDLGYVYDLKSNQRYNLLTIIAKAPITGRISSFIPFLPFAQGEQVVAAHKCVLQFAADIKGPVKLNPGADQRLLGDIRLYLQNDVSICQNVSAKSYKPTLGVRSLITATRSKVKWPLMTEILKSNKEIEEDKPQRNFVLELKERTLVATEKKRSDGAE